MRVDNIINTSSLTGKERAPKASEVTKKNRQIFEQKMFGLPLYLCNAVPSTPIKRGSNGPAYEMRKKRQKKRERKRERKEENMRDHIAKKKKKKKKKKNISMRIHFPTVTPAP